MAQRGGMESPLPEMAMSGVLEMAESVVLEAPDSGVAESGVLEMAESGVLEMAESVEPETVEPEIAETVEPGMPETVEPGMPEMVEPGMPEIAMLGPDLRDALVEMSRPGYNDPAHWKSWVDACCERIRLIADAGVAGAAADTALEIRQAADDITCHVRARFAHAPPFTVSRAAELLLSPASHGYRLGLARHVLTLLRSLGRVLLVSSSVLDYPDDHAWDVQEEGPRFTEIPWACDPDGVDCAGDGTTTTNPNTVSVKVSAPQSPSERVSVVSAQNLGVGEPSIANADMQRSPPFLDTSSHETVPKSGDDDVEKELAIDDDSDTTLDDDQDQILATENDSDTTLDDDADNTLDNDSDSTVDNDADADSRLATEDDPDNILATENDPDKELGTENERESLESPPSTNTTVLGESEIDDIAPIPVGGSSGDADSSSQKEPTGEIISTTKSDLDGISRTGNTTETVPLSESATTSPLNATAVCSPCDVIIEAKPVVGDIRTELGPLTENHDSPIQMEVDDDFSTNTDSDTMPESSSHTVTLGKRMKLSLDNEA